MDDLRVKIEEFASPDIFSQADAYLYSIAQRKWSLDQHIAILKELNIIDFSHSINRSAEDINISFITQGRGSIDDKEKIESYRLESNMNFDEFLFNAVSILDSLAHLVFALYPMEQQKSDRIYLRESFIRSLKEKYPKKKIAETLEQLLTKDWYEQLNYYRDVATHERVIETQIVTTKSAINILLPDNPRSTPLTYNDERKLTLFIENVNKGIDLLLTNAFNSIKDDLDNFRRIPLPIG